MLPLTTTTYNGNIFEDRDPFPTVANPPLNMTDAEHHAIQEWIIRNDSYWRKIPWHHYPAPSLFAPLWNFSQAEYHYRVFEQFANYTKLVQRRLTDVERDALLGIITRTHTAMSYVHPIGFTIISWFMWRSWVKSGAQAHRTAAAATAAAQSAYAPGHANAHGLGHISHFSPPPPPPPPTTRFASLTSVLASKMPTLFLRVARTSMVGLVASAGCFKLGLTLAKAMDKEVARVIDNDLRLTQMNADIMRLTPGMLMSADEYDGAE